MVPTSPGPPPSSAVGEPEPPPVQAENAAAQTMTASARIGFRTRFQLVADIEAASVSATARIAEHSLNLLYYNIISSGSYNLVRRLAGSVQAARTGRLLSSYACSCDKPAAAWIHLQREVRRRQYCGSSGGRTAALPQAG